MLVSCKSDASIEEAARQMSQNSVGSIVIVDDAGRPRGIVTDTDLRMKVVAAGASLTSPISSIMSTPVRTATTGITAATAVLRMIREKVRHICLTEDGTAQTRAIGMISEHDIVLLHGSNPAAIVKGITQSVQTEELARVRDEAENLVRQYVTQGVSLAFVTELVAAVNELTVERLLVFAEELLRREGFVNPGLRFCWLSFGSEGRREQIIRTDQDNALIYEDPPQGAEDEAQAYFLRLGKAVTEDLARCRYAPCPGDNMASNPAWCQSLSAWERSVRRWASEPAESALLNAAIFFDFRPSAGDVSLADELRSRISGVLRSEHIAIILLAKNAVRGLSPLTVLGNMHLEKKGPGRNRFDIKLRGMKPLADAARVLALDTGLHAFTGTVDRFRRVASADPSVGAIAPEAVMAYELFMRHRVLHGTDGPEPTRYIDVGALNRIERGQLRDALRCIAPVRTLLRVRYQLDALGLQ